MFAVLFADTEKQSFNLSVISIGHGVTVIKPQLEGYWAHMPVTSTTEPVLGAETNWNQSPAVTFYDKVCI